MPFLKSAGIELLNIVVLLLEMVAKLKLISLIL